MVVLGGGAVSYGRGTPVAPACRTGRHRYVLFLSPMHGVPYYMVCPLINFDELEGPNRF